MPPQHQGNSTIGQPPLPIGPLSIGLLPAILCCLAWLVLILQSAPATADNIVLRSASHDPQPGNSIEGKILIEAQDGGILFERNDGQLQLLQPEQMTSKTSAPSTPLDNDAIAEQLLKELPDGFRIHKTKHYVIAYETERSYARWIGNLYEGKLNKKFKLFWKNRKFRIKAHAPAYPLVAIIFASREAYDSSVQRELGIGSNGMIAHYNLMTNRIVMYDLTADQRMGNERRSIEQILRDPRSIPMVSTIIHEGTHQLMFNTGLQTRLADMPLWLNEGIAMFFEAPDLNNKQGWRGPGQINRTRLIDMLQYAKRRPENSLETLIAQDNRLQSSGVTSGDAYAESWSLVYFLIKRKPTQFASYLQYLAQKKRLVADDPRQRLADFRKFFGDDLSVTDAEFTAYLSQLK